MIYQRPRPSQKALELITKSSLPTEVVEILTEGDYRSVRTLLKVNPIEDWQSILAQLNQTQIAILNTLIYISHESIHPKYIYDTTKLAELETLEDGLYKYLFRDHSKSWKELLENKEGSFLEFSKENAPKKMSRKSYLMGIESYYHKYFRIASATSLCGKLKDPDHLPRIMASFRNALAAQHIITDIARKNKGQEISLLTQLRLEHEEKKGTLLKDSKGTTNFLKKESRYFLHEALKSVNQMSIPAYHFVLIASLSRLLRRS